MPTLPTELRNKLERVVIQARDVAEAGARAALEALAVHHYEPYSHMSPQQRKLRNQLRARARQLGDRQDRRGRLAIDHLVRECAYEYWHQMLFARFLAENNLLMEPEIGVAISLQEAKELAKEEGTDVWAYASRCAQRLLPQIFRPDDPLLQVSFATEHRIELERLLESLPADVFTASDALGWVYQFWQSKKKDEVNRSEVKIGADELPAVTQLFTEPYMVQFLLHNTLGAWWAGKRLQEGGPEFRAQWERCQSEEDCRRLLALPGVTWEYLRFVKVEQKPDVEAASSRLEEDHPSSGAGDKRTRQDAASTWRPAAGTFDGWPRAAKDIRIMDPCCGSGHFLVAAFQHMVPIRMAEEGLSAREAVDAVLRENLFGLEIDQRCCQIAAFALALAAWTYPGAGGYRELPELNIACSGIGPQCSEDEWLRLAEQSGIRMPAVGRVPIKEGLRNLHRLFSQAPVLGSLIDPTELPADLFTADYETLRPYLEAIFTAEQADDELHERAIAAAGMAKAADLLSGSGSHRRSGFQPLERQRDSSFQPLERQSDSSFQPLERQSDSSFQPLRGPTRQDAASTGYTLVITNVPYLGRGKQHDVLKQYLQTHHNAAKQDLATAFVERCLSLCQSRSGILPLENSSSAAGCRVYGTAALVTPQNWLFLTSYKKLRQKLLKERTWNLVARLGPGAFETISGHVVNVALLILSASEPSDDATMAGIDVSAPRGQEPIRAQEKATLLRGPVEAAKVEAASSRLRDKATAASSHLDDNASSGSSGSTDDQHLRQDVAAEPTSSRLADSTRQDAASTVEAASSRFDNNANSREQMQSTRQDAASTVEAASSRLDASNVEATSGRLDTTTRQDAASTMRLDEASRAWVERCAELLEFVDEDGIVCIPSVRGEDRAADRLRRLLAAAFGDKWSHELEQRLIRETGSRATDLDEWLRNDFFEQHCKLFHHRPFIWHIWDGRRRDGFHALVNYHKLAEGEGKGRRLLESLTYASLGDWITRQRDGVKRGEEGADDRLAAALELQKRLEAILEGEPPFDIFVRWKPLAEQPIGWEPDINDGVRLNIRPFMASDLPKAVCRDARKGAGVLRWKPNIKWGKDRGKEPERPKDQYPWFWGWDEKTVDFRGGRKFDGNRWNGCHYTNSVKQAAREAVMKGG